MSSLEEARTFVDRPAFEKHTFDRIDGLIFPVAPDGMHHLNNRTVQSPQKAVGLVAWQFNTAGRSEFREVAVGGANLFDSCSGGEIETQAERYYRANDERLLDIGCAAPPGLAGEVEATKRIGFPEIDPGTQPVIVVVALLEGLAG